MSCLLLAYNRINMTSLKFFKLNQSSFFKLCFLSTSVIKNVSANAGDTLVGWSPRFDPWLRRFPGKGMAHFQYSYTGKSHEWRTRATVMGLQRVRQRLGDWPPLFKLCIYWSLMCVVPAGTGPQCTPGSLQALLAPLASPFQGSLAVFLNPFFPCDTSKKTFIFFNVFFNLKNEWFLRI